MAHAILTLQLHDSFSFIRLVLGRTGEETRAESIL